MGRPRKYCHILAKLDNDTLYNSTTIARDFKPEESEPAAEEAPSQGGSPHGTSQASGTSNMLKMRHTLSMHARHALPTYGDGMLYLPYQGPRVAWFGWRWKESYCHCLEWRK